MTNKVYDAETVKLLREALEDQQISNDLYWAAESGNPIKESTLLYILKLLEFPLPTRNDAGLVEAIELLDELIGQPDSLKFYAINSTLSAKLKTIRAALSHANSKDG